MAEIITILQTVLAALGIWLTWLSIRAHRNRD